MNIVQFNIKTSRNLYTRIYVEEINFLDKKLKKNTYLVVETLGCIYSSYYKLLNSARNSSLKAELYISAFGVLLSLNGDFNGHIMQRTKTDFQIYEQELNEEMEHSLC